MPPTDRSGRGVPPLVLSNCGGVDKVSEIQGDNGVSRDQVGFPNSPKREKNGNTYQANISLEVLSVLWFILLI